VTSVFSELPESLQKIKARPLFVLREAIPPLLVVGQTPDGFRRVGLVLGGKFEGERLSGVVVSGNDWQTIRPDSCMKLDVRLVLKTTDGALICMTYTVVRAGPPEVMAAMDRGETPDPSTYYFRMSALFETSVKEYDWINRIIAIGVGNRLADGPLYSIFEVL
jgi:Protein of unknown function (DUF3237)